MMPNRMASSVTSERVVTYTFCIDILHIALDGVGRKLAHFGSLIDAVAFTNVAEIDVRAGLPAMIVVEFNRRQDPLPQGSEGPANLQRNLAAAATAGIFDLLQHTC